MYNSKQHKENKMQQTQKHPLENPSLAPFGLATPHYKIRMSQDLSGIGTEINGAKELMLLWEYWNSSESKHRPLPIASIIHYILPSLGKTERIVDGDFYFEELPYVTKDIIVISSIMCWFGTNVGRYFIESPPPANIGGELEFLEKYRIENKSWRYGSDMLHFWLHECTNKCKQYRICLIEPEHHYDEKPTAREYALTEALMIWLGTKEGRSFFDEYRARLKQLYDTYIEKAHV